MRKFRPIWLGRKSLDEKAENVPEAQPILENRTFVPAIVYAGYNIFKLFNKVFMQLEVKNAEVLDTMERPFLICPNHQSFLDPFIITANYPFQYFQKHLSRRREYVFSKRVL